MSSFFMPLWQNDYQKIFKNSSKFIELLWHLNVKNVIMNHTKYKMYFVNNIEMGKQKWMTKKWRNYEPKFIESSKWVTKQFPKTDEPTNSTKRSKLPKCWSTQFRIPNWTILPKPMTNLWTINDQPMPAMASFCPKLAQSIMTKRWPKQHQNFIKIHQIELALHTWLRYNNIIQDKQYLVNKERRYLSCLRRNSQPNRSRTPFPSAGLRANWTWTIRCCWKHRSAPPKAKCTTPPPWTTKPWTNTSQSALTPRCWPKSTGTP